MQFFVHSFRPRHNFLGERDSCCRYLQKCCSQSYDFRVKQYSRLRKDFVLLYNLFRITIEKVVKFWFISTLRLLLILILQKSIRTFDTMTYLSLQYSSSNFCVNLFWKNLFESLGSFHLLLFEHLRVQKRMLAFAP